MQKNNANCFDERKNNSKWRHQDHKAEQKNQQRKDYQLSTVEIKEYQFKQIIDCYRYTKLKRNKRRNK